MGDREINTIDPDLVTQVARIENWPPVRVNPNLLSLINLSIGLRQVNGIRKLPPSDLSRPSVQPSLFDTFCDYHWSSLGCKFFLREAGGILTYARCVSQEFVPDMLAEIFQLCDPKLFGFGQIMTHKLHNLINNIGLTCTDLGLVKGSISSSKAEISLVENEGAPYLNVLLRFLGTKRKRGDEVLPYRVNAMGVIAPAIFLASGYQLSENDSLGLSISRLRWAIPEEQLQNAKGLACLNGGVIQLMNFSIIKSSGDFVSKDYRPTDDRVIQLF